MTLEMKRIHDFKAGVKYKGDEMGPAVIGQSRLNYGTRFLVNPGNACVNVSTLVAPGANVPIYEPFILDQPSVLEGIYTEITTAGSAGSGMKLGITACDVDWQPIGSRLWNNNASPLSITTTGVKSVTGIGLSLPPGRYFKVWVHSSTGSPVWRAFNSDREGGDFYAGLTSTLFTSLVWSTGSYGTGIPDPVVAPTAFAVDSACWKHVLLLDLSEVSA